MLRQEGIEDNLAHKCLAAFTQTKNEAWIIKQRSKTEIVGHIDLGKW